VRRPDPQLRRAHAERQWPPSGTRRVQIRVTCRHTGGVAVRPRYMDRRRIAVVPALTDLAGPRGGRVRLSSSLEWSTDRAFELAEDSDLRLLYETVLREARSTDDVVRFLDVSLLVAVWPRLWLPVEVRRAWEAAFSVLASAAWRSAVEEWPSATRRGAPASASIWPWTPTSTATSCSTSSRPVRAAPGMRSPRPSPPVRQARRPRRSHRPDRLDQHLAPPLTKHGLAARPATCRPGR